MLNFRLYVIVFLFFVVFFSSSSSFYFIFFLFFVVVGFVFVLFCCFFVVVFLSILCRVNLKKTYCLPFFAIYSKSVLSVQDQDQDSLLVKRRNVNHSP